MPLTAVQAYKRLGLVSLVKLNGRRNKGRETFEHTHFASFERKSKGPLTCSLLNVHWIFRGEGVRSLVLVWGILVKSQENKTIKSVKSKKQECR